MAAIIAAIFISNGRRSIPLVMLAYYSVTLISMYVILGTVDTSKPVHVTPYAASLWYGSSISIDLMFSVAVLLICSFERLSLTYRILIFYIVLTKLFGMAFNDVTVEWFVTTYKILKAPVVLLEVSIAWLASDNPVSRKIYRIFDQCHKPKNNMRIDL